MTARHPQVAGLAFSLLVSLAIFSGVAGLSTPASAGKAGESGAESAARS